MSVNKVPAASVLRLELRTGVSSGGNPVLRKRNIANVKYTADDQDLYDVAAALADLQQFPLYGVARVDNAQLVHL